MHATAYLRDPAAHTPGSAVVLIGPDRYLKQQVIQKLAGQVTGSEDSLEIIKLAGKETDLTRMLNELRQVSMWGEDKLVIVESADDFVSKNRPALERYVASPAKGSVLVLDVKSFPKTTKLARAVTKTGLPLECQTLTDGDLARHLGQVAKTRFEKTFERGAAALLVELAGTDLGLAEQELTKLVNFVGDETTISAEAVRALVGGWRAETTWVMLNALRDGHIDDAFVALDKLIVSGEAPQKILGGIHFVFRKLAKATLLAEQGQPLNAALKSAGVFPRDISMASQYLRRIGRPRAEQIQEWLIQTDGFMKGDRRISDRIEIERLLIELAPLDRR